MHLAAFLEFVSNEKYVYIADPTEQVELKKTRVQTEVWM